MARGPDSYRPLFYPFGPGNVQARGAQELQFVCFRAVTRSDRACDAQVALTVARARSIVQNMRRTSRGKSERPATLYARPTVLRKSRPARPVVTLTTDFGLADSYVAAVKAVLLRHCPQAALVDVTHLVPRYDIV